MLLSSFAIDKVGDFDEGEFSPGYGEENDWSLRASKSGYINILCPTVFVYHIHGHTYGNSRQILIDAHSKIIQKRYPNYEQAVRQFFATDVLLYFRHALFFKGLSESTSVNKILVFDHQLGGGAVKTLNEELEKLSDTFIILITKLSEDYIQISFKYQSLDNIEYKGTYSELIKLLENFNIDRVIINTLAFTGSTVSDKPTQLVLKLLKHFDIQAEFRLHDYHSLCPSINLLNSRNQFCELPELNVCKSCLPKNLNSIEANHILVNEWRDQWEALLENCSQVVCYSQESRDRFLSIYPKASSKTLVTKHLVPPLTIGVPRSGRRPVLDSLRIGVVGNLNVAKGSEVFISLAKTIKTNRDSAVIFSFGSVSNVPSGLPIVGMGPYKYPLDLYVKFQNTDLDVILMPSIWPETYNLVSDELANFGIPIVLFKLGAPYERHSENNLFYFTKFLEGPELLTFIKNLVTDFYNI